MENWGSSVYHEKIKELQKGMENVVKENEDLKENVLGQLKNTKVLQNEIEKLTMENNDFKEYLKEQAKHSHDLMETLTQVKQSIALQTELENFTVGKEVSQTELENFTVGKEGLKENPMQQRKDTYESILKFNKQGYLRPHLPGFELSTCRTYLLRVQEQRAGPHSYLGLKEIILREGLWQPVIDINGIGFKSFSTKEQQLLARRRGNSDGSEKRKECLYPWRIIHQRLTEDSEMEEDFLRTIWEIWPRNDTTLNILLLGQAGSGKSSFVNACKTALIHEGRIVKRAEVGSMDGDSITQMLIPFKLEINISEERKDLPVRLFDCRGLLEGNRGVQTEDIIKICKGHIKAGYLIDSEEGIKSGDERYRKDPQEKDKMHCIVYVLAADEDGFVKEGVEKQLKEIKNLFRGDTPQLILLTKIDQIGINDMTQIFKDKRVKECCENAANFLNVCVNDVFPQSNYNDEMVPCSSKDLITLFNIKTIMERANDRVNEPALFDDDSI